MNISPLDIRKHEFKRVMRGYEPDEVMAFLDMISMEFENLVRSNAMFNEKVANLNTQIKKYHDIERILQETLLSAERAREDTLNIAKKQADVIIREAEVKASSIVEEGRNSLSRMRSEFNTLKINKDTYFSKLKAVVNAQHEMINELHFDEEKLFNVSNSKSEIKETEPVTIEISEPIASSQNIDIAEDGPDDNLLGDDIFNADLLH